ncbi:hypothetical protein [Planktotalea sp.]|uniref:hypothetical protein n=1 Tax=Planktotalea sp. TaxID=2029877 RepID=UPI003298F83F
MGLDINVLGKPLRGFEQEFEETWKIIHYRFPEDDLPASRFLKVKPAKLFGLVKPSVEVDREGAVLRFQEISIPVYEAIGAPIVGTDDEADTWLRYAVKNGFVNAKSETEAFQNFHGYRALQAMEDCDGFPIYSNEYAYEGIDRTSFRGSFLEDCKDILSQTEIEQAWQPMLCNEFAEWGKGLRSAADRFAKQHDLQQVLGQKQLPDTTENERCSALHIVDQAARWVDFWSSKGHGSDPYY